MVPVEIVDPGLVGQSYHDPQGREIIVIAEHTPMADMLLSDRPDFLPRVKVQREDGNIWTVTRELVVAQLEEQAS